MKATRTVPNAKDDAPEQSRACSVDGTGDVPDGITQWEQFRAGVAAIASVPKERVDAEMKAQQMERASTRSK